MIKLSFYILLSFMMISNANAFKEITYSCEWEGKQKNWSTLYKISKKKIFEDQELFEGKIEKVSLFLNQLKWKTSYESDIIWNGLNPGKITIEHKVNFYSNRGFKSVRSENGWKKPSGYIERNPKQYIGECHRM